MNLPFELQCKIISYTPYYEFFLVCKSWKEEINSIRIKAVDIISRWYLKKRLMYSSNNIFNMIRYRIIYYPDNLLFLPEFIVFRLNLNEELLSLIPDLLNRKKSDVRDWLINLPLDIEDWKNV